MNTNDRNDPSGAPDGGARGPHAVDPSATGTTHTYTANGPSAAGLPAPKRTPISYEEMDSLLRMLQTFQTGLLWHFCEWAEEARKERSAPAELEAKAVAVFDKLREQFVARLVATLDACPTPIVVEPQEGQDSRPDGK